MASVGYLMNTLKEHRRAEKKLQKCLDETDVSSDYYCGEAYREVDQAERKVAEALNDLIDERVNERLEELGVIRYEY